MPLKLMYITNDSVIAAIAENAGVDRIFIDMEYIGKNFRQGGMDTVQSHHTLGDVLNVRKSIKKAELLVRVNPIHDATKEYGSSKEEIAMAIENGTDIIMLPYFKTTKEVERFVKLVDGKCKTMLLVETPEAVEIIDEILNIDGINECHIGLNDLSLGYGMNFMFELLADGTVERLCSKFHEKGIKYGFGGIASIGRGLLPAENIIIEHYRLGSSMTILSRSFCDVNKFQNTADLYQIFNEGVTKIRKFEKEVLEGMYSFKDNYHEILNKIRAINR
ncbi:MAG: aldolase [Clostridiales bacterium]|nr:MAG: aldolase [Clostridiales bacterium]